jgi:hypothetical protein
MDGTHYRNVAQTIFALSCREFKDNSAPGSKCREMLKRFDGKLRWHGVLVMVTLGKLAGRPYESNLNDIIQEYAP